MLVDIEIVVWGVTSFLECLAVGLKTIGPARKVDVITNPEDTVFGGVHVVFEGTLSDDDSFVNRAAIIHQNEDRVIVVTLVGRSDLSHLTLDNSADQVLFLEVGDGHAAILVIVGDAVIVKGMSTGGSDDPRDITIILQTGKSGLEVDLGIIRFHISSLIGLVVTTEEKIVIVLGLSDRVDARELVELRVPPDSTISLVESNDGTETSVPTDQVKLRLLLGVSVDKVGLFLSEQGVSSDFSSSELDEFVIPIHSNAVVILRISDSEHKHRLVFDKGCVEVGLIVSVIALVVVDGAVHDVLGYGIGRRLDGFKRHETVEVTVSGTDIHHQGNLVTVALKGERGTIA